MKCKVQKIIFPVCLVLLCSFVAALLYQKRRAAIDQWSSQLIPEKITLAELSKEYGAERVGYTVPEQAYDELIEVLKTVTEKNSSRKEKVRRLEEGYRLVFSMKKNYGCSNAVRSRLLV